MDFDGEEIRFPDYGEGGDLSGARRTRRAFRLCIVSVMILTGMLWVAERFLRFDHAESLYLSALTLPRESGRVMLQQAIRTERNNGHPPAAKYVQALAVREEEDVALAVFDEAAALDPEDTLFALRHGARLFSEDPAAAAKLFHEAANGTPRNALASYLEAASVARADGTEDAIQRAMVIVARANNSGDPVIYPRPLWFAASTLPQQGPRYADLTREIVREVSAPLYAFEQQVTAATRDQMSEQRMQNTKIWLEQLRVMGQRLTTASDTPGIGQVQVGVHLQQRAVEELREVASLEQSESPEALIEYRVRLVEATNLLANFEQSRLTRMEENRREYTRPLYAFEWGLALVFAVHILVLVAYRVTVRRKSVWTLTHGSLAKGVWAVSFVVLMGVAHLHTIFQAVPDSQNNILAVVNTAWWTVLTATLLFGFFYPALTLPRVEDVCRVSGRPEEMADLLPRARQAYRRAYASLVTRYMGVWLGLYVCLCCAWAISYRILMGLYPWQTLVLSTGLLEEEREVARQAIALLS